MNLFGLLKVSLVKLVFQVQLDLLVLPVFQVKKAIKAILSWYELNYKP